MTSCRNLNGGFFSSCSVSLGRRTRGSVPCRTSCVRIQKWASTSDIASASHRVLTSLRCRQDPDHTMRSAMVLEQAPKSRTSCSGQLQTAVLQVTHHPLHARVCHWTVQGTYARVPVYGCWDVQLPDPGQAHISISCCKLGQDHVFMLTLGRQQLT